MKKTLLLFLLIVFSSIAVTARTCPKCHGKGKIEIPGVGSYGVSTDKHKCHVCGRWITDGETHWDECPQCGGTGEVGGGGGGSTGSEDMLSNLTPAELAQFENLKDLLKGHMEYPTCTKCNGSGLCQHCGGVITLDGPSCPYCGGTGQCLSCNGHGTMPGRWVEPENKEEIQQQMAALLRKASERASNNGVAEGDNNYLAQTGVAEDGNDSQENALSKAAGTSDDSNDGSIPWWGWAIGVVAVIFVVGKIWG